MDSMTKVALWLIALGLWGLLLKPVFIPSPADAQRSMMDVNIQAVGGAHLGFGQALPVSEK